MKISVDEVKQWYEGLMDDRWEQWRARDDVIRELLSLESQKESRASGIAREVNQGLEQDDIELRELTDKALAFDRILNVWEKLLAEGRQQVNPNPSLHWVVVDAIGDYLRGRPEKLPCDEG